MKTIRKICLLPLLCLPAVLPAQELIRNGGFEDVPAGKQLPAHWSLHKAFSGKLDGDAAEGEKCFKLDNPGGDGILTQSLNLQAGKTYTLTYSVKAAAEDQPYRLYVEYSTMTKRFAGARWGSDYAGTKWEKKSLTFSLPDDYKNGTLVLRQVKADGAIWFDDFKLEKAEHGKEAPDVSREKFPPRVILLRNGGFEAEGKNGIPAGWSTPNAGGKIDTGAAVGKNCFKLDNPAGGILIQSLKLLPGKTYTVTYQVRTSAKEGQKYQVYVEYSTKTKRFAGAFWSAGTAGTEWEKRRFTFTMPEDLRYSTLVLRQIKGSGAVWFDDFTVVEDKAPERKADKVVNPGFEEKLAGWETDRPQSLKLDVSNAKNSRTSLLFTDRGTITQEGIPVARGTRYRLTVNVMCEEFNHPYRFFVGWKAAASGGADHGGISQKFGLERQDGFTAWQTKSLEFTTPVKPFSFMYITLENLAPGKVWFDNVTLERLGGVEAAPLTVALTSPAYRNTFYASHPVREISGTVRFGVKVAFPAEAVLELLDSRGGKIASGRCTIRENGAKFTLPLDSGKLAEGSYTLKISVSRDGKTLCSAETALSKVGKAEYEVIPDSNNMLRINGQPFFPVGLYEPDFTEGDFRRYQRFGFNTILYMSSNAPSIKLVAAKAHQYGLKIVSHYVFSGSEVTQSPAFLGYHNADEPAWMGSDRDTLLKKYREMSKLDPYHPVWMNHAPRNDIETLSMYNEACDISGVDIYPVSSSPQGSGHSDLDDRTISCVGKYAEKMRRSVNDGKPIFMVLQGFAWSHLRNRNATDARYPDYRETRFMVWDSIIHGANGVFYYATNRMDPKHRLWLDMAKVNHEVQSLAAVITAPPGKPCVTDDPLVVAATRDVGGDQVIFMENTANAPRRVKVTFPGFDGKCFELYRDAPIPVKDGVFEVALEPYDIRIFSGKPRKTSFDPAGEYSFGDDRAAVRYKEIPFDRLGDGIMGYDWRGAWIWSTGRPFAPRAYLRRKFTVGGTVRSAHIAVSADASYRLTVNGKEVGSGACCWVAQSYDLTGFFRPGENVIAIEGIGDGGPTGVLFEGKIVSDKGSEYFVSDASWKCAQEAPADWMKPGFDDAKWVPAVTAYTVDKGVWGRIPVVPSKK